MDIADEKEKEGSRKRSLDVMSLNEEELYNEMKCPICLEIITDTMIVMECLHRFCKECIERSLRLVKHECPSCRIHVPSKRSLRRDSNFDELISVCFPDRNNAVPVQCDVVASRKSFEKSVVALRARQREVRKEMQKKRYAELEAKRLEAARAALARANAPRPPLISAPSLPQPVPSSSSSHVTSATSSAHSKLNDKVVFVNFALKPFSDAESLAVELPKPYVRAPSMLKIADVKKLLMGTQKNAQDISQLALYMWINGKVFGIYLNLLPIICDSFKFWMIRSPFLRHALLCGISSPSSLSDTRCFLFLNPLRRKNLCSLRRRYVYTPF